MSDYWSPFWSTILLLLSPPPSPPPPPFPFSLPQAVNNNWCLILNCKESRLTRWAAFWRNLVEVSSNLFETNKLTKKCFYSWAIPTGGDERGRGAVCIGEKNVFYWEDVCVFVGRERWLLIVTFTSPLQVTLTVKIISYFVLKKSIPHPILSFTHE